MNVTVRRALGTLLVSAFAVAPAYATLIDRGDGLIYDDVLDITWLQDAGLGGPRTWEDAVVWADALVFAGFDDWRLPATAQPDPTCHFQFDPGGGFPVQGFGPDCTGSEMGHLHHVDGVSASSPGLFEGVQPDFYWSSSEYGPDVSLAWMMLFPLEGMGGIPAIQLLDDKMFRRFSWAVRDGDVLAAPEPSTISLIGFFSLLVAFASRKK